MKMAIEVQRLPVIADRGTIPNLDVNETNEFSRIFCISLVCGDFDFKLWPSSARSYQRRKKGRTFILLL
jgi:hypothetical protein